MSERHPGIGEQLQHYDRIREDAALAKEVDAEARAAYENEIAHLRAINAKLLEACEALISALAEHWKAWDNKNADEVEACRLGREAISAAKGEQ